jgi:ABC-type transporter Mla MlaB component
MPFEMQTGADGSILVLSGKLGVQQARPLWESLRTAAALERTVLVQARDIEEIDTSIAQILCRAVNCGGQLQIAGASDGFLVSLQRRGLERFFIQSPAAEIAPERTTAPQVESDSGPPVKRRSAAISKKSPKGRVRRG